MQLKGLDISSWQEPSKVNHLELAKQLDFVILRASYTGYGGKGDQVYQDKFFKQHYEGFNNADLPIGAYHFSCADTVEEAIKEAKFLLKQVEGLNIRYPLYMDVEDERHQGKLSKAQLTDVVIAFLKTIESAGYFAGIYASDHWFKNKLDLNRLQPYSKWVANWSGKPTGYNSTFHVWQHTSKGRLTGYSGDLDLNIAYVDLAKVIQTAGLNKQTKIEPTVNRELIQKKMYQISILLDEINKAIMEVQSEL